MTATRNPIKAKPVVDHEAGTVTFAVTFRWQKPWAMDHCEVGCLAGNVQRALVAEFKDWEQLFGLIRVETWEPLEERHIGAIQRPVDFHPDTDAAAV